MPEIPDASLAAAETAIRAELKTSREVEPDRLARVALEAAAPILAETVAQKILAHAERQFPKNDPARIPGRPDIWRTWHRHFGIAARIAAGAFCTREDELRLAAEAIGRGDFIACDIPDIPAECPESKMDDGSHATDYEDSGSCPWCGEQNPSRAEP